jgi:hypothetical protein
MARIRTDELIRRAINYAIQDREAMVEATHRSDPEHEIAKDEVRQLRALYKRRYGLRADDALNDLPTVSVHDLRARHER